MIQGNLPPGIKLKIEGLREHYGLGATPIREALSMLAADGLVERVEQRGFRVAEMRSGEFEELLAVRCTTEGRALRLSIERGGTDWEEAIVLARYRLAAQPRVDGDGNFDLEWERVHKAFHMSLVSGCGSPLLLRLSNQFYDENNRYRFVARLNPSQRRDVDAEHGRIADAVLARDADAAVGFLVDHYRTTGEILHTALRQREETARPAGTARASAPAGAEARRKAAGPRTLS